MIPPWGDQCEWRRMIRMTELDSAVMCNLINTKYTHTCTHTYKTYQDIAAIIAAHQCEVHPEEGNRLLDKLGMSLQDTCRSNQHGVCHKCGDLHTNPSRHSSGCDQTPPVTIPPHPNRLGGNFCETPSHALDPCNGKFQLKRTIFTEQATSVGN